MKKYLIIFLLFCLFFLLKRHLFEKKYNEKIYVGNYTDGFESGILKDEKTGQEYWIYGNDNIMLPLVKKMNEERKKTKKPYISVTLKVKGIDKGKSKGEIAEKGDHDLKVTEIIDIISQ